MEMIKKLSFMDYTDLGYEIMAMAPTKEYLIGCINHYMEDGHYDACAITRYKRTPGEEDAFCLLLLPTKELRETWKLQNTDR